MPKLSFSLPAVYCLCRRSRQEQMNRGRKYKRTLPRDWSCKRENCQGSAKKRSLPGGWNLGSLKYLFRCNRVLGIGQLFCQQITQFFFFLFLYNSILIRYVWNCIINSAAFLIGCLLSSSYILIVNIRMLSEKILMALF